MGPSINEFIEMYGPVLQLIAIVCVVYTLGYHSGNRFRFSRLLMRDPKEIKREITRLQNQVIDNVTELEEQRKAELKDKWKVDRLEAENKTFKVKIDLLRWIINKENN